jgi:hypothetical protein
MVIETLAVRRRCDIGSTSAGSSATIPISIPVARLLGHLERGIESRLGW